MWNNTDIVFKILKLGTICKSGLFRFFYFLARNLLDLEMENISELVLKNWDKNKHKLWIFCCCFRYILGHWKIKGIFTLLIHLIPYSLLVNSFSGQKKEKNMLYLCAVIPHLNNTEHRKRQDTQKEATWILWHFSIFHCETWQ